MGFDHVNAPHCLDDTQISYKNPMTGMTQENDLALITPKEDAILDAMIIIPTRFPPMKMQIQKLI